MALRDCEEARGTRLVLFDNNTRRISPTSDLADHRCPLLHVNTHFRDIALKAFFKIDIVALGPPSHEKYGPIRDWYNEDGELEYDIDIAHLIDGDAREAAEAGRYVVRLRACPLLAMAPEMPL